jgi:hypothetical protein
MKNYYIVEAVIPRISRDGILFIDPEVRDQRLLDLSVYLASQFEDEPTHILRAAGAVGVRMTGDQARKLTGHSMVKAVRLNRRLR